MNKSGSRGLAREAGAVKDGHVIIGAFDAGHPGRVV